MPIYKVTISIEGSDPVDAVVGAEKEEDAIKQAKEEIKYTNYECKTVSFTLQMVDHYMNLG